MKLNGNAISQDDSDPETPSRNWLWLVLVLFLVLTIGGGNLLLAFNRQRKFEENSSRPVGAEASQAEVVAAGKGAPPPPQPGTYSYHQTIETELGRGTAELITTVSTILQHETSGSYRVDAKEHLKEPSADLVVLRTYDWRSDGQYLITWRSELIAPGTETPIRSCESQPPELVVRFPLVLEDSWTYEGICQGTFRRHYRVVRAEKLKLTGRDLLTFVIERSFEGRVQIETFWFSPAIGIPLRVERIFGEGLERQKRTEILKRAPR